MAYPTMCTGLIRQPDLPRYTSLQSLPLQSLPLQPLPLMILHALTSKPKSRRTRRSRTIILAFSSLLMALWLNSCNSLPGSYNARLADHLTETGAVMYGAYWCPHCATQKAHFDGVVDRLPYVECDPKGIGAQPELCAQMQIYAYPTWIIDGEYYEGWMLPGKLAAISGFEPPPGVTAEDFETTDTSPSGNFSPAP